MNVSATLNAFRVLVKPALCLPHATVPTFNHLPIPISKAFIPVNHSGPPEIKALVLDKDDCFAVPMENSIYKPYDVSTLIQMFVHKAITGKHLDTLCKVHWLLISPLYIHLHPSLSIFRISFVLYVQPTQDLVS